MEQHHVFTINAYISYFEAGSRLSESSQEVPDCLKGQDPLTFLSKKWS